MHQRRAESPLARSPRVIAVVGELRSKTDVPQLRIYGIARTRAFRVLWVAKELGLPCEHIPVEIGEAGARKPEYLAINPNGRLPAIDDEGFALWESLAITLYLAKKHSAGRLYPATLQGEAKAWQWSLWSVQEVDRGVNIWSLHAVRLPAEERDGARREEALKVLAAPFKVLDGALAGGGYLLGGDLHHRRSQRCGSDQSRHRHGSCSHAVPCRLAAALPRAASRTGGAGAAGGRRRRRSRRGHARHRPQQPPVRRTDDGRSAVRAS